MALGGGTWQTQDKALPGTYINFISALQTDSAQSLRGVVAVPLMLSWGNGGVLRLQAEDFEKNCLKLFACEYTAEEMLPLRELFRNAKTVLLYRMVSADASKAANAYATARYAGAKGNVLKTVVAVNADDPDKFDVTTYVGDAIVDTQLVASAADLTDNEFVCFKTDASLAATDASAAALTGGTNGTAVTGEHYKAFLTAMESYSFNILCCPSADTEIIALFTAFTHRMVRESGANFQLVCYKPSAADSEYIIGVGSAVNDSPVYGLVYWVSGAEAACEANASVTNKTYDGELAVDVSASRTELAAALKAGKFMLHSVNGEVRVLKDINTLVTTGANKSEDFKSNQIMRLCCDAANRIAQLFNTQYLGKIQNDADGRISLWNDVCKIFQNYEKERAITNFTTDSVVIEAGETKDSVVCRISAIYAAHAMDALYMNIVIA